ncbi:hypothetical protein [Actinomadura keratinilytica]|uniref:Ferric siderophore reductase C-terminal domain-containing protein n=2 Tax=Actinomadura keratinilytica TaxID=547461 RepID=A0ABP7Z745_9ACTN
MYATRTEVEVAAGRSAEEALAPLARRLRAAVDSGITLGLSPDLGASGDGWATAAELATPPYERLAVHIADAQRRWDAPPHIAAALWWKGVAYWTTLPVAVGWALNRRVPLLTADTALVRAAETTVTEIAARDLRAASGDDLGETIRDTLLLGLHAPLIDALHALTRVGRRGLWGSVAEALVDPIVSYGHDLLDDPADAAAGLLRSVGAPVDGLMDIPGRRRRTCCLWVALPGKDACPSCCVNDRLGDKEHRAGARG